VPAYRHLKKVILSASLTLFCIGSLVSPIVSAAPAKTGLSNYSLGVEAYRQGEFRRAFDAWSLGAYEGDAEAQYNLGVLYLEGRGVERNPEQAHGWFLRAAEKGHLEAQYNLGHMALSGMGMEKNTEQALHWWRQAAEGGYPQAQFNYGRALFTAKGKMQDKSLGLLMITKAARQNDVRAQKFLAQNGLATAATLPQPEDKGKAGQKAEQKAEQKARVLAHEDATTVDASVDQGKPMVMALPEIPLKVTAPATPEPPLIPESQMIEEYQPGKVKLNIVRDEPVLRRDYFMRTLDQPVVVYALSDLSAELDTLRPKTLVRVLAVDADKLKIEVVSNLSVWAKSADLRLQGDSALAVKSGRGMFDEPSGHRIGELPQKQNLQILEQQAGWAKLSLPQHIYGWIKARSLAYSGESSQQLQALWRQRLSALKGYRPQKDSGVKKTSLPAEQQKVAQVEKARAGQIQPGQIQPGQIQPGQIQPGQIQSGQIQPENIEPEKKSAGKPKKIRVAASSSHKRLPVAVDDNQWLFTQDADTYVVHVFTLLDQSKANKIANETRYRGMSHLYTTVAKGRTWAFMLLGPYQDVEHAKAARSSLPVHLAKGARVRSLDLIADHRCQKRAELPAGAAKGLDAYCL